MPADAHILERRVRLSLVDQDGVVGKVGRQLRRFPEPCDVGLVLAELAPLDVWPVTTI